MPGNAFHILVALHCISLVSCFELPTIFFSSPYSRWLCCDFLLYSSKATLVWILEAGNLWTFTLWCRVLTSLSFGGFMLLFSPTPKRSSVLADPVRTRTSCGYSERSCRWPLELDFTIAREGALTQTAKAPENTLSSCSFTGIKVKPLNVIVVSLALRQGCDSQGHGKTSCWSGRRDC